MAHFFIIILLLIGNRLISFIIFFHGVPTTEIEGKFFQITTFLRSLSRPRTTNFPKCKDLLAYTNPRSWKNFNKSDYFHSVKCWDLRFMIWLLHWISILTSELVFLEIVFWILFKHINPTFISYSNINKHIKIITVKPEKHSIPQFNIGFQRFWTKQIDPHFF